MIKRKAWQCFVVFLSFTSPLCKAESQSATLCVSSEQAAFSCTTNAKKIISLCLDKIDGSRISYRFGRPEKIELNYSATLNQINGFFYNHYFRYNVDYKRIGFVIPPYEYVIFHDYNAATKKHESYGVSVSKEGEESARLGCAGKVLDKMDKIMKNLKCNDESALGCAP